MSAPMLRLWGDPLAADQAARDLRAFLARASAAGIRCAICWTGARGTAAGGRVVQLGDGGSLTLERHTELSAQEVADLQRWGGAEVSATALLLVFGDGDDLLTATLEYPHACTVVRAEPGVEPEVLLDRVRAALRRHPELRRPDLDASGRSPRAVGEDVVLHFGDESSREELDAIRTALPSGLRLVVLDAETERLEGTALACVQARGQGPAAGIRDALARGVPLVLPPCGPLAGAFHIEGATEVLGGRMLEGDFHPDLVHLRQILGDLQGESPPQRASRQERCRRLAAEEIPLQAPAPARAPRAPADPGRPRVVLEAPLFERSSYGILTAETARALVARGRVDLRLKPRRPFDWNAREFAARYPDLSFALQGDPGPCDLWLSSGWPLRAKRPAGARQFLHRFDWEYGAAPSGPLAVLEHACDGVVVHSSTVRRLLEAAGLPRERMVTLPHGVGAEFRSEGPRSQPLLEWKQGRMAFLYVGGLVWRKGFDLWLSALLRAQKRGLPVCGVVKPTGGDRSYRGYHLGDLLERVRRTPGAPPLMILDEDLSSAEMAALYRSCDLLLHPYRGEGFGMPVLEARACGLPVLATRGGSTDDFIEADEAGIAAVRKTVGIPGTACVGRPFVLEPDPASIDRCLDEFAVEPRVARLVAEGIAPGVAEAASWDAVAAGIEAIAFSRDLAPRLG